MGSDRREGVPHLETAAVHAGVEPDPTSGAVTPPIHLSTTFARDPEGHLLGAFTYTRADNPNRRSLETALCALQGGADAAAFASGSAAASTVFRSLRPGERALAPTEMYHGLRRLLREGLVPGGLELDFVDMAEPAAVRAALRATTKLVWIETPSNPTLSITDIRAVADLAHAAGALVAVDATWTPPGVADPFAHGADLVVHATTKYLAGHSDVLGGVVIALRDDEPMWQRIRFLQANEGAVPSPFDCWLARRGLSTLPYRMRGHAHNAGAVAAFLEDHPRVTRVYYPGLATHPGHAVAARQMTSFGGMLSFTVTGGRSAAAAVAAGVRLFTRATSLGGVESLIEHRVVVEGPNSTSPDDLLRLSIGLEHPDDLIADLEQALERLPES